MFSCSDFEEILEKVNVGDFTYLDPPYAPSCSSSFIGYNTIGFPLEKHLKLFEMVKKLPKFVMSNLHVHLIIEHFKTDRYQYKEILAKRCINSKNPGQMVVEVLISN